MKKLLLILGLFLIMGCNKQEYEKEMHIKTDSVECKLKPSTRPLYITSDGRILSTMEEITEYENGRMKYDSLILPKKPNIIIP